MDDIECHFNRIRSQLQLRWLCLRPWPILKQIVWPRKWNDYESEMQCHQGYLMGNFFLFWQNDDELFVFSVALESFFFQQIGGELKFQPLVDLVFSIWKKALRDSK